MRQLSRTCQFAVVQFEPVERVGAVEQNMALCMDGLQLFQSCLTTTDALRQQKEGGSSDLRILIWCFNYEGASVE